MPKRKWTVLSTEEIGCEETLSWSGKGSIKIVVSLYFVFDNALFVQLQRILFKIRTFELATFFQKKTCPYQSKLSQERANKNLVDMYFLIVKNAYWTKCTPSLTPPTTTHEFIGAYFIPGISQDDSSEVLKSIEK